MSPHRTHDELRSDARHATPLQMRYPHRHLCLPPALAIEPLQQEASARRPIAARHARADDIYPASRQPGLADGKTLAAPIHSLQTPQPEPRPRLDYAASAPLPLRSLLKCTTKLSRTKGCVAQTDTFYQASDENDPFQIAVINMRMPGMDSEALGRAIKADNRLANLFMVLLTSSGVRASSQRLEQIGFSSCTTKPVRREELRRLLVKLLCAPVNADARISCFSASPVRCGNRERD